MSEICTLYIYLGRRGGGSEFNRLLQNFSELRGASKSIFINSKNENLKKTNTFVQFLYVTTPRNLLSFPLYCLSILRVYFAIYVIRRKIKVAVLIMASPWDLPILNFLKFLGKKIIMISHDSVPHPGEIWPRNRSLKKRFALSDGIVFLSQSSVEKYIKQYRDTNSRKTIVIPHPVFNMAGKKLEQIRSFNLNNYLLFIGRISKYKGLDTLQKALSLLPQDFMKVVIAGEGRINNKFSERALIINRWLTSNEIEELIDNASIIVFPYIEASQSGFLPMCISKGKRIIISNLPSLEEQSRGYHNVFIFESENERELAFLLKKLSNFTRNIDEVSEAEKNLLSENDFAQELREFIDNFN